MRCSTPTRIHSKSRRIAATTVFVAAVGHILSIPSSYAQTSSTPYMHEDKKVDELKTLKAKYELIEQIIKLEISMEDSISKLHLAKASAKRIIIKSASYAAPSSKQSCDATPFFEYTCNGKPVCAAKADNTICGDPDPAIRKKLTVQYQCNKSEPIRPSVDEGVTIYLYCSPVPGAPPPPVQKTLTK